MRVFSTGTKVIASAACALAGWMVTTSAALGAGVEADPSVARASYDDFDGLAGRQLWDDLDTLEYWAIPLSPPDEYYKSVDATSGSALRDSLHEVIRSHHIFPYSHSSRPGNSNHKVDVWDIVAIADAHPETDGDVLDLYLNGTFERQLVGTTSNPRYDREHSWPKSLGFPKKTRRNPAYSDCHHLFAAYNSYNSARSNKPYGTDEEDSDVRRITMENVGRGGSFHDEPESSNYSFSTPRVWQTWIGRRGDVARAMFYMAVRYEGDVIGDVGEPDLKLTDDAAKIKKRDVWESGGKAYMGLLQTLLDWHCEDAVDDLERRRNTVVFLFQGNRNPFVDHPEWVATAFGGSGCGTDTSGGTGVAWINEFHYDNAGSDRDEFVEIAGTAGLDLSGWKIIGYNGSGGSEYKSVALTGSIPDQGHGFGAKSFDFKGLQNASRDNANHGAPDGIALVDADGQLVELLSYEGTFTASGGPADDQLAEDIGVFEPGTTPTGRSLSRTGTGCNGDAFEWTGPAAATRDAINTGQHLSGCP